MCFNDLHRFQGGIMSDITTRFIQMDNWIFEVKSVRAIRVDNYGDPYNAIANLSFNCDTVHIDGLLTQKNEGFTKKDYDTFYRFCHKLGVKEAEFNRFKGDKFKLNTILAPKKHIAPPPLKLVR